MLAANAALRKEIVPKPVPVPPEEQARRSSRKLSRRPRWQTAGWAWLLERVFGVDGFRCPRCRGPLRLRCVVINPPATLKILSGLARSRAPPGGLRP